MQEEITALIEKNLNQVWAQRDASLRIKAIETLYRPDAGLYHVGHQTKGHEAINASVGQVLESFPEEFSFFLLKPVLVNNNMAQAHWGIGSNPQFPTATGIDIALIEDGKIKSLYVFLD